VSVSSFYVVDVNSMDYVNPTAVNHDYAALGQLVVGGGKAATYRPLFMVDVFGAALSGLPLTADDVILDAQLDSQAINLTGATAFQCHAERNTRDDWVDTQASWNNYKLATAWSTAGGDVAVSPDVTFTSPAAEGLHSVTGLAAFVTEAIASHGGKVQLRLRANNESTAGFYEMFYSPTHPQRPRLVVTYTGPGDAAIAEPVHRQLPRRRPPTPSPATRPAQPVRPVRGARR
jgi:hypothetical protein